MKKLLSERGATLVEYVTLCCGCCLLAIVAVQVMGTRESDTFVVAGTAISNATSSNQTNGGGSETSMNPIGCSDPLTCTPP